MENLPPSWTLEVGGVIMYTTLLMRRRTAYLFLGVVLFMAILEGRLFYVQVIQYDHFKGLALDQRLYPVPVDARRGTIRDRHGRELAVSVSADSIYAVPAEVKNPDAAAEALSRALGLPRAEILDKLTRKQATVWIERKVDEDKAHAVKQLELPGIGFTEKGQRFYPKGSLCAHVLGIAGIDNQGLEGLELEYDRYLSGKRGEIEAERDATGREIPGGIHRFVPPVDGCDIYLTIDEVIQYITERELDRAMKETKSKRGIIIAMDPKTGGILAMASRPTYDPNRYSDYPAVNRRNIALTDAYEPGSTFKIVTAAAALNEGVVRPETPFFDPGYIKVEDRYVRCWLAGGHGSQTFVEATENSCNPVFASIGLKLGKEKFYQYIRAFGFGERTNVDFPGEASGMLQQEKKVGLVEIANISFGQGISVTPLQLLSALCTIANNGMLMRPYLVQKIVDSNGDLVKEFQPVPVRQVISPETAKELSVILESVVVNGSGTRAQIKGYRVAGKTGTAEKPEAGRYGEKRISSFLGFAPVDDPRIAVLVVLDEPDCGISYGGVIAAPVFKSIVEDSLRYLKVPAAIVKEDEGKEQEQVEVPNVRGLTFNEAKEVLTSKGFLVRTEGEGEIVAEQVPKPGVKVAEKTCIILYFNDALPYNDKENQEVKVPDLKGLDMRSAIIVAGSSDLRVQPEGAGWCQRQDPVPGVMVPRKSTIRAYFQEGD
ncbi:MAG TPA: stage V sporulation protein D [Firmicutes bacterium]|nr:stage V sporulation protein D [Bacillota bacterium]